MVLLRQLKSFRATVGYKHFETPVAGEIAQHTRVVRIVLHDEQDGIVGLKILAIVGNLLDRNLGDRQRNRRSRRGGFSLDGGSAGCRRPNIRLRQVESESAAPSRSAAQLDFSTQQAGELAADGEPEAGASVLAAGAGICLLEGF